MNQKKNGFAGSVGFIMAAAGSAIGLGNLWAFPYKVAKNGGAAFVLIYIASVLLIGFLTMIAEMHIGRRAQANPVTAFKSINKNIGWMGLIAVLIPGLITCYYSVLGGWTLKFAASSFTGKADVLSSFCVNVPQVIGFTALFVFLALIIIAAGVQSGIERMSKVLMPILFVILIVIVIYSLCLGEGVKEGLAFYLKPDFSSMNGSSILAAMSQAFYSLSLGMGIMLTYGSYTGREINLVRSTVMICVFDTLVALLAGLAIFPAVAHFDPALLDGSKGVALLYIIMPQVFASMGIVGRIISFFFFMMVAIAALTSIMSLYEVCTQFILQKYHLNRKRTTIVIGICCLLVSIPIGISLGRVAILEQDGPTLFGMDWLTFFDEITNTVLMPICACMSCIAVGWILTPRVAIAEIRESGTPVPTWLEHVYCLSIRWITPVLILIIEIGGVINSFKNGNGPVVYVAYAILALTAVVYFLLYRNTATGTNEDELYLNQR